MNHRIGQTIILLGCLVGGSAQAAGQHPTIGLENIMLQGDLQKRIHRNFDRLETLRYQPVAEAGCFREGQYDWPGDMEGRTILSLALLEQSGDRKAIYLPKTLDMSSSRLNSKGFFGADFAPKCDEQQLSGHGWLLRGLCEYYLETKNPQTRKMIENIVNNLVLPTQGKHKLYPIDPAKRDKEKGGASGTVVADEGLWRLSSDIGCDFIFMDGVVQAAEVLGRKDLHPIIDEMVNRFLEIDLVAIKAQTHATLTALRGLIRYANLAGRPDLIAQAKQRFDLYVSEGSTENHMNYNWFGRPTHTEPCAIVDAFMVAMELWQATGKTAYLEEAHRIYFNGLCHAQRANGGFGLEACSGSQDVFLKMKDAEAWWCCTMRGSEGLVRAEEYSFVRDDDTLMLPFFNAARVKFNEGNFEVQTQYPYEGEVTVKVVSRPKRGTAVAFLKPSWSDQVKLTVNGKSQPTTEQNGFVAYRGSLKAGDMLVSEFAQKPRWVATHNRHTIAGYQKLYQGPLLLAAEVKGGKPAMLPRDAQLNWDAAKHCVTVPGTKTSLIPINDIIDWNYQVNTYSRQILWQ